jgi:hypothetical protein
MLSVTPPGQEGRRPGSHRHGPPYEGGAFLCRATSAEARAEGLEPSFSVLETDVLAAGRCPCVRGNGGSRTRRLGFHRAVCQPLHHMPQQSAEGAGVEPARQCACSIGFQPGAVANRLAPPLIASPRSRSGLVISTPTRSRTQNVSFEARRDFRFTIGAQAEGEGVEPPSPMRGAALAPQSGQPYPATFQRKWTHWELNPDSQSARLVSSRWTMSPFRLAAVRRTAGVETGRIELPQDACEASSRPSVHSSP